MTAHAESAAAQVLDAHDVAAHAPVDIEVLAVRMGVANVIERRVHGDGRLERDGRRTTIVVRSGTAWPRRRFTIAHELGHLYLGGCGFTGLAPSEEERFCNRFAAALLMPEPWIRARCSRTEGLGPLRAVARDGHVSLSAALVRLRELLHWSSTLIRWRHDSGSWRLSAVTGLPSGAPFPANASGTSAVLDRAARSNGIEPWGIPLSLAAAEVDLAADVWVNAPGAVALTNLRSALRSLPSRSEREASMWRDLIRRLEEHDLRLAACEDGPPVSATTDMADDRLS